MSVGVWYVERCEVFEDQVCSPDVHACHADALVRQIMWIAVLLRLYHSPQSFHFREVLRDDPTNTLLTYF